MATHDRIQRDAAEEHTRETLNGRRDLVMSRTAFEKFAQAIEAPADVVPETVEMFRLPRIPEV